MNQAGRGGGVVSGIDTSRRFLVEELKGDENHIDEEGANITGGELTLREPIAGSDESAAYPQKLVMSGRRPAKSVDRTARGVPIPSSS